MPWVANLVDRGQQVLVLDLLFTGEGAPDQPPYYFTQILASTGQRPLGMEASQLKCHCALGERAMAPATTAP
jgi:hypothetical protein